MPTSHDAGGRFALCDSLAGMYRQLVFLLVACGGNASRAPADAEPWTVELKTTSISDASVDAFDGHASTNTWEVRFSPKGGCQSAVVALIASAKMSVRLAGYSFTSQPIADALIARHAAGLAVEVVLDRENAGVMPAASTKAPALKAAGVPVWIDSAHAIFHDKFVIVDGKSIELGSFNYTAQAETSNAENCFVYHSGTAATAFDENWLLHRSHSAPY